MRRPAVAVHPEPGPLSPQVPAACEPRGGLRQTVGMSSPRRACPVCTREIAVVGGRYARHDPPGRRTVLELISCPGSRRIAPMMAPAEKLFDPEEPPIPGQQPLF
ncbi:hypothetical protein SAMN05428945_0794 [Streptomyces sp. 2224.1]|nr:hypothetical protein SAMN05428945_0794 [Streptomyces sp. 2224.1]SEE46922.1 hypothetical protein SAMN05428954_2716 [Streptomyces sp. 2112.3]